MAHILPTVLYEKIREYYTDEYGEKYCAMRRVVTSMNDDSIVISFDDAHKYINCTTVRISSELEISMLHTLPNSVKTLLLNVSFDTGLTIQSVPGKTFKRIYMSYTAIDYISQLPTELEVLDCSHSFVSNFHSLPSGLKELYASHTRVQYIQNILDTVRLVILDISHTNVTSIVSLPITLKRFNCSYTNISILPTLPETLKYLNCSYTNIKTIPNRPKALKELIGREIEPWTIGTWVDCALLIIRIWIVLTIFYSIIECVMFGTPPIVKEINLCWSSPSFK